MIRIIFLGLITVAQSALTYRAVDWSSVLVEEAAGITYKSTSGTTEPLENILKAGGVNTVRQRLWVNPVNGTYDLAYNLKIGKRANAAGIGVYLNMHFSDIWADPGHQAIPSGWPTDIGGLTTTLYNYTLSVANSFASENISVTIVEIGNEIGNGILWPVGDTSEWANLANLLHAASTGIKASNLSPKPEIMIHLDNGWEWSSISKWYTNVLSKGNFTSSDFDIMAFSHYPFYGAEGTFDLLKSSLTNMATTWGKKLMAAETDWPISCPKPGHPFPADVAQVPFSPAGQTTWMQDLAKLLDGVSGGCGISYWEPAWIQAPKLGSSCADCLMFDSTGKALSSVNVFGTI